MKKILFGCIVSLTVFSCNKKPDKDDVELRAQVMASCESTALSPEMSEEKEILVKEYCSCSTDKMLGEFTYAEMMMMNNPTKELEDRLKKMIYPCLKDLEGKSAELEKK